MKVADLFARLGVEIDDNAFKAADRLLGKTRDGLLFMAKAAAAAATAIAGAVVATAAHADEVGSTAEKIGVNAQRFQELGFAAQQSDTSIGALTQGLAILSRTMYDAENGSKEAADAFKDLGIDPKQFKTADEAFRAIAEKISKLPPGTRKTALAMKLLGKSGKELVPLLNIGAEGIDKFSKEANELGLVMSDAGLQAGSDFGDSLNKIKRAAGGLLQSAILPMLPALTKVMDQFTAWAIANKDIITSKIAGWVKDLTSLLITLGNTVSWVSKNIGTVLSVAVGFTAANAFRALTVAMTAAQVTGIRGAIAVGAAWLASIAPVILVGAAIALLILIVQDLYTWFKGGNSVIEKYLWRPFKAFIADAWQGVKDFGTFFKDFWIGIVNDILASISNIPKRLKSAVSDYFSGNDNSVNTSTAARGGAMLAPPVVTDFLPGVRLPESARAAQAASSTSNNMSATINVTSPNPEEAGKAARREIEAWWGSQMRGAEGL